MAGCVNAALGGSVAVGWAVGLAATCVAVAWRVGLAGTGVAVGLASMGVTVGLGVEGEGLPVLMAVGEGIGAIGVAEGDVSRFTAAVWDARVA
ncbi:MAG: hypothetical protein JXA74_01570 [Anaerolineae bacterium]|nr:hypothetical protein [Anaerolineae bacterium]